MGDIINDSMYYGWAEGPYCVDPPTGRTVVGEMLFDQECKASCRLGWHPAGDDTAVNPETVKTRKHVTFTCNGATGVTTADTPCVPNRKCPALDGDTINDSMYYGW